MSPPPPCDATCRTEARRRQLANAFGIGDPEAYVSSFAQTRHVEWPMPLVLAARAHLDTVKAVEVELGVLLLEKQLDRLDVRQPLTREQRRLVHEMVEVGYGMVSSSRDLASGGRCVLCWVALGGGVTYRVVVCMYVVTAIRGMWAHHVVGVLWAHHVIDLLWAHHVIDLMWAHRAIDFLWAHRAIDLLWAHHVVD